MADSVAKNAPGSAGEWEFLYGKTIPFKHELHVFFWHLPGIVAAVVLGLVLNMLLEEFLKRISKQIAEHKLVTLVWMGAVVYLIFFTPFDAWIAAKIQWAKIVPRPPVR